MKAKTLPSADSDRATARSWSSWQNGTSERYQTSVQTHEERRTKNPPEMEAANASAISRSSLGEGKHTSTAHLRSDLITYSGAAWEIYIAMHIPDTEAARATARSRSSWDSFAFTSTHQERSQNKGEHGGGGGRHRNG